MNIEWKNLEGVRHIFSQGETICGAIGLENGGHALPCEVCLVTLLDLEDAAFMEINA